MSVICSGLLCIVSEEDCLYVLRPLYDPQSIFVFSHEALFIKICSRVSVWSAL